MENSALSLVLQIKEQIEKEKAEYLRAVENSQLAESREIAERITLLQSELQKLQPKKPGGYDGL